MTSDVAIRPGPWKGAEQTLQRGMTAPGAKSDAGKKTPVLPRQDRPPFLVPDCLVVHLVR